MFLMMAEVLHFGQLARANPDNWLLALLAFHQSHVPWEGGSLHDMIQPSFSFLVGTALAFSLVKRRGAGEGTAAILRHAAWRSIVLIALGILLRSQGKPMLNFTFEDTLTQIGLGYFFLVWIGLLQPRAVPFATALLLLGYWLAFALYPAAGDSFSSHWAKGTNLAAAFDRWFLNLFPRPTPFVENRGGYSTLSFVPTLGTMLLGLAAGRALLRGASKRWMLQTGGILFAAALLLHYTGLCPIVKRIWTPAWVLASGGVCFWFLALFRTWLDGKAESRWAFPLLVVGANSIAAYLIAHWWDGFFASYWKTIFWWLPGVDALTGVAVLLCEWFCLYWLFRRRIYLKI